MGASQSTSAEEDANVSVKKKKSKKRGYDAPDKGAADVQVPDSQGGFQDLSEPPEPEPPPGTRFDFDRDDRNDYLRNAYPDEAASDAGWGRAWPPDGKTPLPDFPLPDSVMYGRRNGDEPDVDPVSQDVYTCQSIGKPMEAKPDLAPMPSRSEMQDPFYMWRRGGGLERQRVQRQHQLMCEANDPFAAWRPQAVEDIIPRVCLLDGDVNGLPRVFDVNGVPRACDVNGVPLAGDFPPESQQAQQAAPAGQERLLSGPPGEPPGSRAAGTRSRNGQALGAGSRRPNSMQAPPSSGNLGSMPIGMVPVGNTNSGSQRSFSQNLPASRPGSFASGPASMQNLNAPGSLARAQLSQPPRPPKTTVRRPSPPPSGSIAVH